MGFFDHVRICDWVRRGEIDWGFWALFYVKVLTALEAIAHVGNAW